MEGAKEEKQKKKDEIYERRKSGRTWEKWVIHVEKERKKRPGANESS